MPDPRSRLSDWLVLLRPWPLLGTAVVLLGGAIYVLMQTGQGASVGAGLAAMGAVCLGAWIALLAAYGHSGHHDDTNKD